MEIKSTLTNHEGKKWDVVYREDNPETLQAELHGAMGYCFCDGKFVIVSSGKKDKKHWAPPGGGIEKGETYQQATIREIHEESNMKVLYQQYIGYEIFTAEDGREVRQTRSFCIVEPYGDFVSDPDGDITEIKLIDPKDYKQYFDWGELSDHVMQRALELKVEYEKNKNA